jgi:hypothetical protein
MTTNCRQCGRDTEAKSGVCYKCALPGHKQLAGKGRGQKGIKVEYNPMDLEDDYSEESNADSVCNDFDY